MAKISLNDHAPSGETVSFSLANAETFELGAGAKKFFETDDPDLISNANAHPWLQVEVATDVPAPNFHEPAVRPEDDTLGRFGPNARLANDPDEVKKANDARAADDVQPLAVQAGLDQDKEVVTGEVAETLAADDEHKGAKSPKAFKTSDKTEKDA
jgi:hypothetical protein